MTHRPLRESEGNSVFRHPQVEGVSQSVEVGPTPFILKLDSSFRQVGLQRLHSGKHPYHPCFRRLARAFHSPQLLDDLNMQGDRLSLAVLRRLCTGENARWFRIKEHVAPGETFQFITPKAGPESEKIRLPPPSRSRRKKTRRFVVGEGSTLAPNVPGSVHLLYSGEGIGFGAFRLTQPGKKPVEAGKVSYFGPAGNITAGLLTGTYTTPEMEENSAPVVIRTTITPNKKLTKKKKGKKPKILKKTYLLSLRLSSTFDPSIEDAASIRVQTK